MSLFRGIFPTFERPVAAPHYMYVKPQRRGLGLTIAGGAAAVLACAIALTPPPPDVSTSSDTAAPPVVAGVAAVEAPAAPAPEKTTAQAAKTAVTCARTTARKDCVEMKAAKAAILASPDTEPAAVAAAPSANSAATAARADATEAMAAAEPVAEAPAVPANAAPRAAARQKARKKFADDAPVERLVRVYDQILPDGRRVPVYRRASGGYESGNIVDGEYRRAFAAPPERPRYFGLQ